MGTEQVWQSWLKDERLDSVLLRELEALTREAKHEELQERFSRDLEFGTGGMRAKLGVGINRMNVHTVRLATYGVVKWLMEKHPDKRKLAIGYDGRHKSREFAEATAQVAVTFDVEVILYRHPRPTPFLSFAVRHHQCGAGVMVTASHNPPEYNGYKVYGADGGQILSEDADTIVRLMQEETDVFAVPFVSTEDPQFRKMVTETDDAIEEAYYREITSLYSLASDEEKSSLKVVYTPLHGTGKEVVPEALHRAGFAEVLTVPEQMRLDPDFRFTKSPNPEEESAYDLAVKVASDAKADVIFATDPDTDRVGVMTRDRRGEYVLLTGNEVGALALDFYLEMLQKRGSLPENGRVVTTIVTSNFGEEVAKPFGVVTERVLTGFKYIGDRIHTYEEEGNAQFVFGYEESVGYLALPFVRDKDAVQATVLLASMAANRKQRYGDLVAARDALFEKYGYFRDQLLGFTFAGQSGLMQMQQFMSELHATPIEIGELPLVAVEDYLTLTRRDVTSGEQTTLTLPEADVVKYFYQGGSWLAVRPSGTEPKLKVYLGAKGADWQDAEHALKALHQAFSSRIAPYLKGDA